MQRKPLLISGSWVWVARYGLETPLYSPWAVSYLKGSLMDYRECGNGAVVEMWWSHTPFPPGKGVVRAGLTGGHVFLILLEKDNKEAWKMGDSSYLKSLMKGFSMASFTFFSHHLVRLSKMGTFLSSNLYLFFLFYTGTLLIECCSSCAGPSTCVKAVLVSPMYRSKRFLLHWTAYTILLFLRFMVQPFGWWETTHGG